MRVGICDDDLRWCKKAERLIRDYGKKTMTELEILNFQGRQDLEAFLGEPLDVLFLDIDLKDSNGIELAAEVNRQWEKCQIVYMTNYLFYATEVYRTSHIYFILKEQFEERLGEIFGKVLHALSQSSVRLVFSVIGGAEVSLFYEDILYFERDKRITNIITKWGKYEIRDKLDAVMERLPRLDFVRCHNSYIVYLPAVREMMKGVFIMRDGTEVMISRSHGREVKAAFLRWSLSQVS